MKRIVITFISIALIALAFGQAVDNGDGVRLSPRLLNYQGFMTDTLCNPINGSYDILFRIYDDSLSGNLLWSENQLGVPIARGIFHVLLGSVTPIPDTIFTNNGNRWLSLRVSSQDLTPRTRIVSSPYSITSTISDTALYVKNSTPDNDWTYRVTDGADTTLQTGGRWGLARQGAYLYGSADSTHVNLGVGCETGTLGQNYRYCTVGGGLNNFARGDRSVVSGGSNNDASGVRSVVGGGAGNTASNNNAIVVGGYVNSASGYEATIVGGEHNNATGPYTHLGGGAYNTAGGDGSFVGGGQYNTASGLYSVAAGGYADTAGANFTVLAGGYVNKATASFAAVGGGFRNIVEGTYSAILGGYADTITETGDYSYLFGINSNLTQDSTFMVDMPHVWFGTEAAGYEFPRSRGADGQVMVTNSAGVLSWGGINYVDSARVAANAYKLQGKDTVDLDERWVNEGQAAGGDLTGNYPNPAIADNAVNSAKILDGAITAMDIRDTTITAAKIKDGAVTMAKINQAGAATGQVIKWDGTAWQPGADSAVDRDWLFRVTDGADTTLQTGGRWGLARAGGALYGIYDSTHVNLGVACTTGISGQHYGYCVATGGRYNVAGNDLTFVGGGQHNTAGGFCATVGGGMGNRATNMYSSAGGGRENVAGGDMASVSGGYQNVASGMYAYVGGGVMGCASNSNATVTGGYLDSASGYCSAIVGGYNNNAGADMAFVGGGNHNNANGAYSTVAGGDMNVASGSGASIAGGSQNSAAGNGSFIGSGADNSAGGAYAAIGGGIADTISGVLGFIGGGYNNLAGDNPADTAVTVAGGLNNEATGRYAAIGGGREHRALGDYSTISGGYMNTGAGTYAAITGGRNNYSPGSYSSVGGGWYNNASDSFSTIAGGYRNHAIGKYSVIPGGYADTITATGDYSYLFGINSNLTQDSTFMVDMPHVWYGTEANGYELPRSRGANGQIMITNGAGQLSWSYAPNDNDWIYRITDTADTTLQLGGRWGIARPGNTLNGNADSTHVNLGIGSQTGYLGLDDKYCTVAGGQGNIAERIASTVGGGQGNAAGGEYATIGGGYGNTALWIGTVVAGGYDNYAYQPFAAVCGGDSNAASQRSAVVAGGHGDTASAICATVVGGSLNLASGSWSFVGGGLNNTASGMEAFVGGGAGNMSSGNSSSIAGGDNNYCPGAGATIGGGSADTANGGQSTISGGSRNKTDALYGGIGSGNSNVAGDAATDTAAVVAGGRYNRATSQYCAVGGGVSNVADVAYAVVAGGQNNHAGDYWATVGGGYANYSSNNYATIPGGRADTASGLYSFAANDNSNAGYSNSAAFNGQTASATGQTRVGVLAKTSGTFTIDHPLDPENKILNHYFVESPDMSNMYSGSVVLDAAGRAAVDLPDYFDVLNKNPRVQLTGVGSSDVFIAEDIQNNGFAIGGKPGMKVYWTVIADRKDPSAEITRIIMPVEQTKTGTLAGRSLDDEFLVVTREQLEELGKAGGFTFRHASEEMRYEEMKREQGGK